MRIRHEVLRMRWLAGAMIIACNDGPTPPAPRDATSMVVASEPVSATMLPLVPGAPNAAATPGGTAYVSLPAGQFVAGRNASIRHRASNVLLAVQMVDGGFDPVPLAAAVGDTVDVTIRNASDAAIASIVSTVPKSRRPRVVRTVPPRRRADVPLNTRIIVVFDEPIAGALSPASIQLRRGTTTVTGTVRFVDASGVSVEFFPNTPLSPLTEYQLIVSADIRDGSGDLILPLEPITFTTGQSLAGEAASIRLSPTSVANLEVEADYPISATVLDANDNVLSGRQIAWSSNSPAIATVIPADSGPETRGRVTGVSPGPATIVATTGSIAASASVTVVPRPAPKPTGVFSVTLALDTVRTNVEDRSTLKVTLRNAAGLAVEPLDAVVTWQVGSPAVLQVDRPTMKPSDFCGPAPCWSMNWNVQGLNAVGEGITTVIVTSEGMSDTAIVVVGPRRAVATVSITPASLTLLRDQERVFEVVLRDAMGGLILRPATWSVDDPRIATLDTSPQRGNFGRAWITAKSIGSTRVTATAEGVSSASTIDVPLLAFVSVSATDPDGALDFSIWDGHTCGLTESGRAFCWGGNDYGQLGGSNYYGSSLPVAVTGGLAFGSLTTSGADTCGLTLQGKAYCWGYLTDTIPVAVQPNLSFVSIDGGVRDICGLTTTGSVSCWGYGGLQSVVAGPVFAQISVGDVHACGLTTTGLAYCWGEGDRGQLGDGRTTASNVPVAVQGDLRFTSISAGHFYTCGITTTLAAFCWGTNTGGELGDGTTELRATPAAVAGGLTFTRIVAGEGIDWGADGGGGSATCALASDGTAFCWGRNRFGQLGDNSNIDRNVPAPVSTSLKFSSISSGGQHTCAVAITQVVYCWGSDPMTVYGSAPMKVPGQP